MAPDLTPSRTRIKGHQPVLATVLLAAALGALVGASGARLVLDPATTEIAP